MAYSPEGALSAPSRAIDQATFEPSGEIATSLKVRVAMSESIACSTDGCCLKLARPEAAATEQASTKRAATDTLKLLRIPNLHDTTWMLMPSRETEGTRMRRIGRMVTD